MEMSHEHCCLLQFPVLAGYFSTQTRPELSDNFGEGCIYSQPWVTGLPFPHGNPGLVLLLY